MRPRCGRLTELTLTIVNTYCEHCLAPIREAACKRDGVEDVTGNPTARSLTVTYQAGTVTSSGIRAAIVERGFRVVDGASEYQWRRAAADGDRQQSPSL